MHQFEKRLSLDESVNVVDPHLSFGISYKGAIVVVHTAFGQDGPKEGPLLAVFPVQAQQPETPSLFGKLLSNIEDA